MYISPKRLILLLGLIVLLLVGGVIYKVGGPYGGGESDVNSFSECVEAGNPVAESYPRQCRTTDGRSFTEEIKNISDDKSNLIRVSSPQQNEVITSPLTITGEARGTWYFEASFPVVLVDWDGLIIAEGHAEAQSDWMTEEFVPFRAELTFKAPIYKNYGTLILRKDNPSGLPEHDNALEVPVLFRDTPKEPTEEIIETGRERGGCMITGCSGQVCGENDVITTCEYRPEYACYEQAVCERQAGGQCGWTLTAAMGRCLQELSPKAPKGGEMLQE